MEDDINKICKQKLKPIEYHTQTSGSSNSHDQKTITTQTNDQNMQRYATTQTVEACDQKNATTQTDNALTYSQKFATTQTDNSVFPNPRHISASAQTTAEASNSGEHGAQGQNNYLDNAGTTNRSTCPW